VFVIVLVVVLASGADDEAPAPQASAVPAECTDDSPEALRRRLGKRIVVRMESEATPELVRQARRGEIGGLILFPPEGQEPDSLRAPVARVQRAAAQGGHGPLVVAIDQEGGIVERLALPPDEAPPELAGDSQAAEAEGVATGEALARIGVNVDLAPVLDVPESPDSFIAERAFGGDPAEVASTATAFATGLQAGGVSATAKHFPGLGRSVVNTDEEPSEVDASRAQLLADLEPFESAIDAGIDLVMLSNATYPELDPDAPAFASPAIAEGMLRDDLGFEGVTITDDLEAGAVRALYSPAEAAVAAAAGGSDLLLFALRSNPDVLDSLVEAAERGELPAESTEAACVRISALKTGTVPSVPGA
jgi:beta-N-acetylhexosaminidase